MDFLCVQFQFTTKHYIKNEKGHKKTASTEIRETVLLAFKIIKRLL